jgi:hypothetical protein
MRIHSGLRTLSCAVIGAATAAAIAVAVELPHRKAGLWEMSLISPAIKGPPHIARYCIDADTEALLDRFAGGRSQRDCSKNEVHREGSQFIVDSVCTVSNSRVTGRAVITASGDTSFHMNIHTHFDPPLAGPADVDTVQDSKWLGACPADMKPGDAVTENGVKVNLKDVAGAG